MEITKSFKDSLFPHKVITTAMIRAEYKDKNLVIDILAKSFNDNKSVNYIIKQDKRRGKRIIRLMNYAFELCYRFGAVFLSPGKEACALIMYPDKKRFTLASKLLDIELALFAIGLSKIRKALSREAKIEQHHPAIPFTYLWFIGVDSENQNKGLGTTLLQDILRESATQRRPVYLETSTLRNMPWYEKNGFEKYDELDLGFKLYLLRKNCINEV